MDDGKVNDVPKALIVDLSIRYGGASTRAISIAQALAPWGCMIAGIHDSPVIRMAREKGIAIRILGKRRTDPLIPFRLAGVIRKDGIQVVDTQNIQSKVWTSLAALLVNVAFVSTLNSFYKLEHGRSWKSWFYSILDLSTNWKTDRFIAVSDAIRKGLIEDGVAPETIDLIRNAVPVAANSTELDAARVREQVGIPDEALLCILVGRLVWAKGFDDFIAAFSGVVKRVENVMAVIVGEGNLRKELEDQVKKLDLENNVLFLGHRDRSMVMRLLSASNIYIMSSRSEGIPYALLEAAAFGLPIVSTDCGGVPEVLEHGESALLVPVGDIAALTDAIVALCRDRSVARALGEKARRKIQRDYSLELQMSMTKKAYLRAISDKKNHNSSLSR